MCRAWLVDLACCAANPPPASLVLAECEISGTVVKIMKENGDAVLPGRRGPALALHLSMFPGQVTSTVCCACRPAPDDHQALKAKPHGMHALTA